MGAKRGGMSSWIDRLRKLLDERSEPRVDPGGQRGILTLRGEEHEVWVSNLSRSGAMVVFDRRLEVGEPIRLRLLDQAARSGQVRWVRDGRVGISFDAPGR